MRAVIFVTFALLAGCATSLEKVQSMRDAAPEWYDARKVEIGGEGYPSVGDIPTITRENRPGTQLRISREDTLAALRLFQTDLRATGAEETAQAMLSWAIANRRAVEGQVAAPDFLTDEDVQSLKAVFDTPRGRL